MKRSWFLVAGFAGTLAAGPLWGFECPTLITQGREQLAAAKLPKANEAKVKALLDEAQKLHERGSHDDSVKKANEALALLKKK
jgi:hypothetical protein